MLSQETVCNTKKLQYRSKVIKLPIVSHLLCKSVNRALKAFNDNLIVQIVLLPPQGFCRIRLSSQTSKTSESTASLSLAEQWMNTETLLTVKFCADLQCISYTHRMPFYKVQ